MPSEQAMAVRQNQEITRLARVETASWIQREAPELDPAFAVPTGFNAQRAVFTQRKPYQCAPNSLLVDISQLIYQSALQEAVDRIASKFGSLGVNYDHLTWEDVIERTKEAENKYLADGGGLSGYHRKVARKIGDYASAFKSWIQLIPDADGYGSSIRGALGVVLVAAEESARVRKIIIQWFADFPELLLGMQNVFQVYPKDQDILRISADLSVALLRALETMIKWLSEKTFARQLKTLLVPTYVSDTVDIFIKDVEKEKLRLERRANFLRDYQTASTHLQVNHMNRELPTIRRSMVDLNSHSHGALLGIQDMMPRVAKSQDDLRHLRIKAQEDSDKQDMIAEMMKQEFEKLKQGIDAQNGLFGVLLPLALNAACKLKWMSNFVSQLLTNKGHQGWHESDYRRYYDAAPSFVDQQELFNAMQVDVTALESESLQVMREGWRMDPLHQSGAYEVAMQPKFIDRISSERCAALFVDVDSRSGALDRVSAFSILSATLAATMKDMRPALVLQFFCGFHLRSDDPLRGPTGIARSFLAQLLTTSSYDLSFVDSRTYVESVERHHLGHLCDALRHLVRQLKRGTVLFLFLDGLSLYERSEWTQDLHEIMYHLQSLITDPKVPATVKLLVTNPGRSRYVIDYVPLDDRVWARMQAVRCSRIDQRSIGRQYCVQGEGETSSWRALNMYEDESDEDEDE